MDVEQPEASSSTFHPVTRHAAAFLFDPSLSREAFTRLIEQNGAVHSLVQRISEQCRGADELSLSMVVPSLLPSGSSQSQLFADTAAFLTTLPRLAQNFRPLDQLSAAATWPGFASDELDDGLRVRAAPEQILLDSAAVALDILDHQSHSASQQSSQAFQAICPTSAGSLLTALYTPPATPREGDQYGIQYLLCFAGSRCPSDFIKSSEEPLASNWNQEWDGKSWTDLVLAAGERDIKCSVILAQSSKSEREGPVASKLRELHNKTLSEDRVAPWFDLDPGYEAMLSGLDSIKTDSPLPMDLTEGVTAQVAQSIVQPSSVDGSSGNSASSVMAMMNSGQVPLELMENFLSTAASNGMDLSHPSLTQIRQLVTLQRQHRQGQVALNPAAAAAVTASASNNPQAAAQVQRMLASMQQSAKQKAAQRNENQPSIAPVSADQGANGAGSRPKVWSGVVTTPTTGGQTQSSFRLPVDVFLFSDTSVADLQMGLWPTELRLAASIRISLPEIHTYIKTNAIPILSLVPQQNEPASLAPYRQFTATLGGRGMAMSIPLGGQTDRGILLFGTPVPNPQDGTKMVRLMGAVCLNTPFPASSNAPPNQPAQLARPPMQQPSASNFARPPAGDRPASNLDIQQVMLLQQQQQQQQQAAAAAQQQQILQQQAAQQQFQQMQHQQMQTSQIQQAAQMRPAASILSQFNPEQIQALLNTARARGLPIPPTLNASNIRMESLQQVYAAMSAAQRASTS